MKMTKDMETYFTNANFDIEEVIELINNSDNLDEEICTLLMNQISPNDFVKLLNVDWSICYNSQEVVEHFISYDPKNSYPLSNLEGENLLGVNLLEFINFDSVASALLKQGKIISLDNGLFLYPDEEYFWKK